MYSDVFYLYIIVVNYIFTYFYWIMFNHCLGNWVWKCLTSHMLTTLTNTKACLSYTNISANTQWRLPNYWKRTFLQALMTTMDCLEVNGCEMKVQSVELIIREKLLIFFMAKSFICWSLFKELELHLS